MSRISTSLRATRHELAPPRVGNVDTSWRKQKPLWRPHTSLVYNGYIRWQCALFTNANIILRQRVIPDWMSLVNVSCFCDCTFENEASKAISVFSHMIIREYSSAFNLPEGFVNLATPSVTVDERSSAERALYSSTNLNWTEQIDSALSWRLIKTCASHKTRENNT